MPAPARPQPPAGEPRVDRGRFLDDLRELATFGALDPGVERLAFGPADRAAREWLAGRMAAAGLDVQVDGCGTVHGRAPGVARAVLVGSHSDTVPRGGWLDGALGVVAALEVARAYAAAPAHPDVGVDVVSFADEEGTFLPTLGSTSFCGELDPREVEDARDAAGRRLADALVEAGYAGRPLARLDAARHLAFVELHIEQGPRLEAEGARVAVVTGIAGTRRRGVRFRGRADHAGTTPMALRRDAGAALIRYAAEALELLRRERGPDTVWNIGRIALEPGVSNVVPSGADLLLEYRDTGNGVLSRLDAAFDDLDHRIAQDTAVEVAGRILASRDGAATHPAVRAAIAAASEARGVAALPMPSGAGHDARVLGRHLPAGMVFVPSIGGRSHDVAEDTADDDLVLGAEVLASAVARLASTG